MLALPARREPRQVLIPEIVSDVPRRWFAFEPALAPAVDLVAGGGVDCYRSYAARAVGSLIDVYG